MAVSDEKRGFMPEAEDGRESWDSKLQFMLATIGYAVGLGNVNCGDFCHNYALLLIFKAYKSMTEIALLFYLFEYQSIHVFIYLIFQFIVQSIYGVKQITSFVGIEKRIFISVLWHRISDVLTLIRIKCYISALLPLFSTKT